LVERVWVASIPSNPSPTAGLIDAPVISVLLGGGWAAGICPPRRTPTLSRVNGADGGSCALAAGREVAGCRRPPVGAPAPRVGGAAAVRAAAVVGVVAWVASWCLWWACCDPVVGLLQDGCVPMCTRVVCQWWACDKPP
jgi:hypothetical protein